MHLRFLYRSLAKLGLALDDHQAGQDGAVLQVGALPFRLAADGALSVLLITGRTSGRWIVPKGWPVKGLTLGESAAREAHEEAGVTGEIGAQPLGTFQTVKRRAGGGERMLPVLVFPLQVRRELPVWRESGQRQRRWLAHGEAVGLVANPGLAAVIAAFGLAAEAAR